MPDAMRPGTLRRLRFTPLTDLLRGRLTGRLDVAARIDASGLPAPALAVVRRVARRTRLWRAERADVAAELAAHFADGLEAGATADELVTAFGDERQAARLIRRAKIRNRPLAWHVLRNVGRVVAVLLVVYAALAARYFLGRPTVSVDYLAKLNAPIERVPEDRRAWPLYRQVIERLELARSAHPPGVAGDAAHHEWQLWFGRVVYAEPGGSDWPELTAWLDRHAGTIEVIREAAARPTLGFVLGPSGSQRDPPFDRDEKFDEATPLLSVLLPNLNHMREMANVLAADVRLARERRDGGRIVRDLDALLGLADQTRSPFVVNQLVGIGIAEAAQYQLDQTLSAAPDLLDDDALVHVAHRLSELGGRTPLVDLAGERMFFYDVIQRSFTDDGRGDGRLTHKGLELLGMSRAITGDRADDWPHAAPVIAAAPIGLIASRREQLAEYDRLMNVGEAQLRRPAREADWSPVFARLAEIKSSAVERTRYLPIALLVPSLGGLQVTAERTLGRRDGLVMAAALELHRRRHGAYPATLDRLVPHLLPAVPIDRVSGDPVRYKLTDGKPVLYSVGVDQDDDGGRPPLDRLGSPSNYLAAEWPRLRFSGTQKVSTNGSLMSPAAGQSAAPVPDGDWVLYPEPKVPPAGGKAADE